jgi:hypothetical protein
MKNKRFLNVLALVVLAAALVLGLVGPGTPLARAGGAGDPGPGTVVGIQTVTFASGSTAISSTTYYNDNADSTVYSSQFWHSADVFVTVDLDGTNVITVTPQWSADGTNWVDAKYKSEGWVLPLSYSGEITTSIILTNSSGVTNTTTTTSSVTSSATNTFAGTTAERVSEWVTYQVVLNADGSSYIAIPLHGSYLRIKAEVFTPTNLTPTIITVLRNDGGR